MKADDACHQLTNHYNLESQRGYKLKLLMILDIIITFARPGNNTLQ